MQKKAGLLIIAVIAVLTVTVLLTGCDLLGGDEVPEVIEQENKTYRSVTFDVNGGDKEISPMEFEVNVAMENLPIPVRQGYDFMGWKDRFGNAYDKYSEMPSQDLFLIATWDIAKPTYQDEVLKVRPGFKGKKQDESYYEEYPAVDEYLYVEVVSEDLIGGAENIGYIGNFDLLRTPQYSFSAIKDYTINWYEKNWDEPLSYRGFSLDYGSNLYLMTVNDVGKPVKTYLVDFFVPDDYIISLHYNINSTDSYKKVYVAENHTFDVDRYVLEEMDFELESLVYYDEVSGEYEVFDWDIPVTQDWELYQVYKEKEIKTYDEEGNFVNTVYVKPYTQYLDLGVPEREGYDFIGWKVIKDEESGEGYYFADVTGFSSVNYLSFNNYFNRLTAVFRPKRFYFYEDASDKTFNVLETVPVAVYTDRTQTQLREIIYTVKGGYPELPSALPETNPYNNDLFKNWATYTKDGEGEFDAFDFTKPLGKPQSVFAVFEDYTDDSYTALNLQCKEDVYANKDLSYIMWIPANSVYKLEIVARSEFQVTLNPYLDKQAQTFAANPGETLIVDIDFTSAPDDLSTDRYVSFTISQNASTRMTLIGDSAARSEQAIEVNADNTIVYGTETTFVTSTYVQGYHQYFIDENGDKIVGYFPVWESAVSRRFEILDEYTAGYQTLTFDSMGGNEIADITQLSDSALVLPEPEREGYTFIGWFESSLPKSFAEKAEWTAMPREDKTLYAGWINDGARGDFVMELSEDGTYYCVTSCTGSGEIIVPETAFGLPVEVLKSGAFASCDEVTGITVPQSVKRIEEGAFGGCGSLENLSLPFLGEDAGKTNFSQTNYPLGYLFGTTDFVGGEQTEQYYYSETIYGITSSVYYVPASLNSVVIRGGGIYYGAFYNCRNLSSITIPDGLTQIGEYAFYNCAGLQSILLPETLTELGDYAFAYCASLKDITVPDGVECVTEGMFTACASLESITLSVIELKNNVIGITEQGLLGSLFGEEAYEGGEETQQGYYDFGQSVSIVYYVPTSLKSVTLTGGDELRNTFYNCKNLTSITIPGSIKTSISAFSNCINLEKFYFNGTLLDWVSIKFYDIYSNPSYYADSVYIGNRLLEGDVAIPDGATAINEYAFYNFDKITSITLPDSVTEIGRFAFENCVSLKSVDMSDTVTEIDDYAFDNCTSLESIVLPRGITAIRYAVFRGCGSLKNIEIPDQVTEIEAFAFKDCARLTSIVIPDSVATVSQNAFDGCNNLDTVYYLGNADGWAAVLIDSFNDCLTNAVCCYYSESQPADEGNYWHYVQGVPTVW